MSNDNNLKIALTFDDAPSVCENKIPFLPSRMDKVCEILKKNNINNCTAFVIGKSAIGHEDILERWLDAGFHLGNHTYLHNRCNNLSDTDFIKTVSNCDKVLESVGAFSKTDEKWFRFPYLDRGKNYIQRQSFKTRLDDLGYKIAHASMNFCDDKYEAAFESVIQKNNQSGIDVVASRYLNCVPKMISLLNALYVEQDKGEIEHIAYTHFGAVSEHLLDRMLTNLNKQQIEWTTLSSASTNKLYKEFEANNSSNGLVLNVVDIPSLPLRLKRKLTHISENLKLFKQSKYGPIWPYLR